MLSIIQVCVQECLMREEMKLCGCVRPDYEFAEYAYPREKCTIRQRGEFHSRIGGGRQMRSIGDIDI